MPDIPVRGLTICQPWASLIALGEKRVENRKWFTDYRGPLVIHAGKSKQWLRTWQGPIPEPMPFGEIVALANLVACVHIIKARSGTLPDRLAWVQDHEFTEGPWCLILDDIRPLEQSVSYSGALGLWDATQACSLAGLPTTFDPDERQV